MTPVTEEPRLVITSDNLRKPGIELGELEVTLDDVPFDEPSGISFLRAGPKIEEAVDALHGNYVYNVRPGRRTLNPGMNNVWHMTYRFNVARVARDDLY